MYEIFEYQDRVLYKPGLERQNSLFWAFSARKFEFLPRKLTTKRDQSENIRIHTFI